MAKKYDEVDYAIYDDGEIIDEYEFDDDDIIEEEPQKRLRDRKKKKKKSKKLRNLFLLLLSGLIIVLVIMWRTGQLQPLVNKVISSFAGGYIADNMGGFNEEDGVNLTYNFDIPETIPEGYAYDKDIINVLLVGVEAINSNDPYRGRSDSMMLVSVDTKTGSIKLVSFLRDTYVAIPGHDSNKLNAAFAFGSMDLLLETLTNTYKIYINSVCLVNFDTFQGVIDTLGGVDITLSEKEAEYLNTTNYVSDEKNRNLVAGLNHMNGNQALGYCRVRKVEITVDGRTYYSDFGRTIRQRTLIKSVFAAYKSYPKTKILGVTNDILGNIKSNLSKEQVEYLLNAYLEHPDQEIASQQIPAAGFYDGATKDCGECLVMDKEANIEILHHFLYGTELSEAVSEKYNK